MTGRDDVWDRIVQNIRSLAGLTYVTVGMVFTPENVGDCMDTVMFADSLGVDDIRVIPAAQSGCGLRQLAELPDSVLARHPILRYRVENAKRGRPMRGLSASDSARCRLVLDDMAVAGGYHFPCIIYLREGGEPIGRITNGARAERARWSRDHDTKADPICAGMCLDVCVDYNNTASAVAV